MTLVVEFLSALALVVGIVIGESVATMAFGRPKQMKYFAIELVIFVLALILITRTILLTELDLLVMMGINSIVGVVAAIVSRGISTLAGYLSAIPSSGALSKYTREEKLAIGTIETLSKYGVEKKEIKQILYDTGFSKKIVEDIFKTHKFTTRMNPLVKRIAELEEKLKKTN